MAIPDRAIVEMQLRTVRPESDLPESPDDNAEVRIGRGLKHPKDEGYATFLITLGYDRNWAGMLAARIVDEGRVRAATAQKKTEFARALRRLANPRLDVKAFLADGQFVLEAMNGTLLTDDLFTYSAVRRAFVHSRALVLSRRRHVLSFRGDQDSRRHLEPRPGFPRPEAHN